jgi:hypothetical protein
MENGPYKALNNIGVNISSSLIFGFSVLTIGILASSVLNNVSKLQLGHLSHKYGKELKEVDKEVNLSVSIAADNKMISYYWYEFRFIFVIGITGVTIVSRSFIANMKFK